MGLAEPIPPSLKARGEIVKARSQCSFNFHQSLNITPSAAIPTMIATATFRATDDMADPAQIKQAAATALIQ